MATFRKIARNEFPSADPTRLGKTDVAYAYMDETMQTIIIQIPIEDDTPERIQEELKKRLERAATAGPAEITV